MRMLHGKDNESACFRKMPFLRLPAMALALALVGCDATPPRESSSASRAPKVAVAPTASPMTSASSAPPPLSSEFTGEPCAIVALEGGTAILDRVAADVLRLQIRDTAGRIIGDSPAAVFSLEGSGDSKSVSHVAFYPLSPRELLARLPAAASTPTTGTLRLLSFNDLTVQERPLILRCPDAPPTPLAGAEDTLTSPVVHAGRLRQFLSSLENAMADSPEKAGVVLEFMLLSAQDSARLGSAQVRPALTDAARLIETAKTKVTPAGALAGEVFENFRAELEHQLSKIAK